MSTPESPWTRESIIEALLTWAALYGAPPGAKDWVTTSGGPRFAEHAWPSTGAAVKVFGSWNAAVEAAGFVPTPRPGWKPKRGGA